MTAQQKPKKIGRPRVYTLPMTNRERQQRWRDRVRAAADALLAQLKLN